MESILQNIINYGLLILVISFIITYIMIPKLIGVIRYKKLMDNPNARSSHKNDIPTLGGITFYISLIVCMFFIQVYDIANIGFNIIAALTILFIAGLKDDLVILSVRAKIFSQLLAITFLLMNTDIHIYSLYGFFGIAKIPLWFTIGFSYFTMLSIINAYNLIDGIDGLASMLGILMFSIFGLVFYSLQLYFYFLICVIPIGFLVAFLRYNLSNSKKIFMGDTGSMIIGFLIGLLCLRFLSLSPMQLEKIHIQPENLLLLTLAIISVPFIDTLRIVVIRFLNKKSLFKPDRNHVHHILIDLGLSHIKSSILLTLFNVFIITLFLVLNLYLPSGSSLFMFSVTILFTMLFLFHLNRNYRDLNNEAKIKTVSVLDKATVKLKLKSLAVIIFRIFF